LGETAREKGGLAREEEEALGKGEWDGKGVLMSIDPLRRD